jgi:flagellar biosynthesis/type III secretory pathway protein FliH
MAQTPAETRAAQALAAQVEAKYCTPKMLANPKESARCHAAATRDLQKQTEDALAKARAANTQMELNNESMARIANAYAKGTAAGRQQEIIEQARGWRKPYVTCRTQSIGGTAFTNCD